jgi:hypothetical protein
VLLADRGQRDRAGPHPPDHQLRDDVGAIADPMPQAGAEGVDSSLEAGSDFAGKSSLPGNRPGI